MRLDAVGSLEPSLEKQEYEEWEVSVFGTYLLKSDNEIAEIMVAILA